VALDDEESISTSDSITSQNLVLHDVTSVDLDSSFFTERRRICQLQFKCSYKYFTVPLNCEIVVGNFLVVKSHIDPTMTDMGVVTIVYNANEYFRMVEVLDLNPLSEENVLGEGLRLATEDECNLLPSKLQNEESALAQAQITERSLGLSLGMCVAEYQFDGKVLFLYCDAVNSEDINSFKSEFQFSFSGLCLIVKRKCDNFVPQSLQVVI